MLGAKSSLQRAGITVDAAVSRSWNTGVSIVRANPGYQTVVFQLGHNNYLDADSCSRLLGAVGGRRLVLMTIQLPEISRYAYEDPNNEEIRACAARSGATFVDWNAATNSPDGALARDGIHLTAKGAALFTTLVTIAL
jgi:hypothetical protein